MEQSKSKTIMKSASNASIVSRIHLDERWLPVSSQKCLILMLQWCCSNTNMLCMTMAPRFFSMVLQVCVKICGWHVAAAQLLCDGNTLLIDFCYFLRCLPYFTLEVPSWGFFFVLTRFRGSHFVETRWLLEYNTRWIFWHLTIALRETDQGHCRANLFHGCGKFYLSVGWGWGTFVLFSKCHVNSWNITSHVSSLGEGIKKTFLSLFTAFIIFARWCFIVSAVLTHPSLYLPAGVWFVLFNGLWRWCRSNRSHKAVGAIVSDMLVLSFSWKQSLQPSSLFFVMTYVLNYDLLSGIAVSRSSWIGNDPLKLTGPN